MSTEIQENDKKSAQELLRDKAKTSKRVAWILDDCIRIPGTKIRFGLDPILGVIPGGGEIAATLVGVTVVAEAGKKGIPIGTLIKMGGNMISNALIGAVPVLGDLFSVWFKSNKRNYELMQEFLESNDGKTAGGWGPLAFALIIIGFVIVINLAVVFGLVWAWMWVGEQLGIKLPWTNQAG